MRANYVLYLIHVIEAGVAWNKLIIRQLVVITLSNLREKILENRKVGSYFHHLVPGECSSRDLPEHETKCVHVGGLEGLDVGLVERLVKNLRRHVAPGADPRVGRDVDLVRLAVKPDGEPEVGDGAGAVPLDEDVLGLDVPVGHGGLALGPEYLRVQMAHL